MPSLCFMKATGSTECFAEPVSNHQTVLPFKDMTLGAHLRWCVCFSTPEGRWLMLVMRWNTHCALLHGVFKQKSLAVAILKAGV